MIITASLGLVLVETFERKLNAVYSKVTKIK